jgi:hypothetical protein
MSKLLGVIDRILGIVRPSAPVVLPRDTALVTLPDFIPPSFHQGVEILNDDSDLRLIRVAIVAVSSHGNFITGELTNEEAIHRRTDHRDLA